MMREHSLPSREGRSLIGIYVAVLAALGSIFGVVAYEVASGDGPILYFIERYLSVDGSIELPLKRYSQLLMISAWLMFCTAYCAWQYPTLHRMPAVRPKLLYALIGIMCIAFVLDRHGFAQLPLVLYEEDGVFETLTFIAFFVAAALAVAATLVERRTSHQGGFMAGALVVACGLFLLGMEEISWGQRILGWESPEFFAAHNDQQETNLHNFFNDFIWLAYQLVATAIATVMVLGERPRVRVALRRLASGSERLLPRRRYFYLAIVLVLVANYNELFEEVFAVFALVYTFDLLSDARRQGTATG